MATINLDKMALSDMQDLQEKLAKAIIVARDRERIEVKQKIEALVQDAGFSLSDLGYGGRGGRTRAAVPKYVNPDNRSETWTGRGRKPNWLISKISKGSKMEDFSIG